MSDMELQRMPDRENNLQETALQQDTSGVRAIMDRRLVMVTPERTETDKTVRLTDNTDDYALMTNGVGVDGAPRGALGARFACEATVEVMAEARAEATEEAHFVAIVTCTRFRSRLVERWQQKVSDHLNREPAPEETENPQALYDAMLLFAVVTEHSYVTGCLGNGRVLLLNAGGEVECRIDAGQTATLAQEHCANDGFRVDSHDRKNYCGVVLATKEACAKENADAQPGDFLSQLREKMLRLGESLGLKSLWDWLRSFMKEADGVSVLMEMEEEDTSEEEEETAPPEAPEVEIEVDPEEAERERRRKVMEAIEQEHMRQVAENVEKAKDPSLYDSYFSHEAAMHPAIRVYGARRMGRSHIRSGKPCQDYCQVDAAQKDYMVLTAADGVGSCPRSDVGSRYACETTVELVNEIWRQCGDEKVFVERLCSLRFRELLVNRWVRKVMAHGKEHPVPKEYASRPYECYGSTLMFAVITPRLYVVGNLGDGQILLFNKNEGVKLRLHAPKESTKVRALVHPNCHREDFRVGWYSREEFGGILLTTDGMYDCLSQGNMLHKYALELSERFDRVKEPLQPFVFREEGEEPRDLCAQRTHDDCTVVLALDSAFRQEGTEARRAQVMTRAENAVLEQLIGSVARYEILQSGQVLTLVASPREPRVEPAYLAGLVKLEKPLERWEQGEMVYAVYPSEGGLTLDELFDFGKLREQSERTANASNFVGLVYEQLLQLTKKLQEKGLRLSEAAGALLRMDEQGQITALPEAFAPAGAKNAMEAGNLNRYFHNLEGWLYCGEERRPIFKLGYLKRGQSLLRLDDGMTPMCRTTAAEGGKLALINLGDEPWTALGGEIMDPKTPVVLEDGLTFWVPHGRGLDARYIYRTREAF